MHKIQTPSSLRRFISALLTLALVAGVAPVVAVAAPTTSATVEPATAQSTWVKGSVAVSLLATDITGPNVIHYLVNDGAEATTSSNPFPLVLPASLNGTQTVRFFSSDESGVEQTKTVSLKMDNSAPVSTATLTPSTWTSQTVSVSITSTDQPNLSGFKELHYRFGVAASWLTTTQPSVASVISTEGVTAVSFYGVDNAGNTEATQSVDVKIDRTPPVTTSNAKSSYVNTATIILSPSDGTGSGVKTTYYRLDGGAMRTGTSVVATASTTPTHTVSFWSDDAVGNVETSRTVTFTVTTDASAPVTTLVTKAGMDISKWQSANVTFTLTATDTPAPPAANSGVASMSYRLDGGSIVPYVAGTVVTVSKEGTTTLEYWSVDGAGVKEATKAASIRVDKTLPVASTNAVAGYIGTATVSISATDTLSGVAAIKWWIGSGAPITVSAPVSGASTFKADAFSSAPGTQTLSYVVVDVAGNQTGTQSVTFHETRQPSLALTSKSAWLRNTTNPAKVTIAGKLLDAGIGVAGKQVLVEYSGRSDFSILVSAPATTAADGSFSLRRNVYSRTYYRVRFEGDSDNQAALSSRIYYVPRAQLSTPKAPSIVRAKRAFWVVGTIKPAHASGRRVLIHRYQLVRGKRVYRGAVWTTITRRTGWSNYQVKLSLPRGTWYIRAYAPYDVAHQATYSAMRRVIAR